MKELTQYTSQEATEFAAGYRAAEQDVKLGAVRGASRYALSEAWGNGYTEFLKHNPHTVWSGDKPRR